MIKSKFNLEERTAKFGEQVIDIMKKVHISPVNKRLVEQIIGSAGSLGANYCEGSEAQSKKDFIHKIAICKKETKETQHWLRLLARANPEYSSEFRILWIEAHELLLIFAASSKQAKKSLNNIQ